VSPANTSVKKNKTADITFVNALPPIDGESKFGIERELLLGR
jgi:hypothetical protein